MYRQNATMLMNKITSSGNEIAFFYMSNYVDWPQGGMLTYVRNILPEFESLAKSKGYSVRYYGCKVDHRLSDFASSPIVDVKTTHKILPNSIRCLISMLVNRRYYRNISLAYSHTEACTIALKILNPACRVIHHQHGLSYKSCKGAERFHNFERYLAQKLADDVLVVAGDALVADHAVQMGDPNKYHSVGSPIQYSMIQQIRSRSSREANGLRFVYSGRLIDHKNVQLALRAFALFEDGRPSGAEDTFVIIGSGPKRGSLEEEAGRLGIHNKVVFLGLLSQERVLEELALSDILLFPSKGEGVSLAVLEAMASGLPVVCCDVVGLNDLVIDEETGSIAKELTCDAFASSMRYVVAEKDRLSKNCLRFSSAYSVENICHRILSIVFGEE